MNDYNGNEWNARIKDAESLDEINSYWADAHLAMFEELRKEGRVDLAFDLFLNPSTQVIESYVLEAFFSGRKKVVSKMVGHGANVNILGTYNRTPLVSTIIHGDFLMVPILLNLGADMRVISARGLTPIQWACKEEARKDDIPISREFMMRGAKLIEFNVVKKGHPVQYPDQRIVDFYGRIERTRETIITFLSLKRKTPLLQALGKDVVRFLAKCIYQTRGEEEWNPPRQRKAKILKPGIYNLNL
jgi:hypothetical protein